MRYQSGHLSEWTLELLAEGALPPEDAAIANAHVEDCSECAAELDGYRALFAALSGLPQFEPSPAFADVVMSRVRIAPQAAALPAWLTRWLPSTWRGWTVLVAVSMVPALPVIMLVAWLVTQAGVSPLALWDLGNVWIREASWAVFGQALVFAMESGAYTSADNLVSQLLEIPVEILAGAALVFAIGIPLSAWTLYNSLRTPVGGTSYAH